MVHVFVPTRWIDAHDLWNLVLLGILNVAHMRWWLGWDLSNRTLEALFVADGAYLFLDFCWLVCVPSCVPPKSRITLLIHHAIVIAILPLAFGKPVLMRHLLRTWIVELHSWNHVAARHMDGALAKWARAINKPLFVVVRLIGFPVTYVLYVYDRATLSEVTRNAQVPYNWHLPLSCAHAAMYGLMLKWGYGLLCTGRRKD